MSATYLGSFTVGGALVGLETAFNEVGSALQSLKATVDTELGNIANAQTAIDAQVDAIGTAKAAIRVPAVADFQAQLDAAVALGASFDLQLSDPAAYLSGLLDGIAQLQTNIGQLQPQLAIQGQIDATASTELTMTAKIEAVDAQLEALATISTAIATQLTAIGNIRAALSAAVSAVLGALSAYASMLAELGTAGAHVFLFEGNLGDIGTDLDAAIAGLGAGVGIDASTPVKVPIVAVDSGDSAKVQAVDAVFRVSP